MSPKKRVTGYVTKLLVLTLLLPFFPIIFVLSCALRLFAILISCFHKDYGKFIGSLDGVFNEEFVKAAPRTNIVGTIEVDGDLTLEDVRSLFKNNVLNATIPTPGKERGKGRHALRYPELQQYLSSLLGFRVWKRDPSFKVENHIFEEPSGPNGAGLDELHEKYLNLKFPEGRSPWELIVIRNVRSCNESGELGLPNGRSQRIQTLLVFRIHHILGDGISILSMIVEGLGQKPLKIASAKFPSSSWTSKALLPIHVALEAGGTLWLAWRYFKHPWKKLEDERTPIVVKFSKPVAVDEIKRIAKLVEVKYSAVLLAILSGGIRRYDEVLAGDGVPIGYVLPKLGHPKTLTNHFTTATEILPTDVASPLKRLLRSNQVFTSLKRPERSAAFDLLSRFAGSVPKFVNDYVAVNYFTPLGVTNVAGETESFEIGGRECSDLLLSVGVNRGCAAATIQFCSYMGHIRFGVIAKESILGKRGATKIANFMETELDALKESIDEKFKVE